MDVQQELRISQFLPTVKCIDCGQAIEAHLLSKHECGTAPAVPTLPVAYQNNVGDMRKQHPARPVRGFPTAATEPPTYDSYGSRPPRSYSPYEQTSPTDSGYSSTSGKYGNMMPTVTSRPSASPKPQTAFMQKYEKAKQATTQSPSENVRQDYYGGGGYVDAPMRSDSRYPSKSNVNVNLYDRMQPMHKPPNGFSGPPSMPSQEPSRSTHDNRQGPMVSGGSNMTGRDGNHEPIGNLVEDLMREMDGMFAEKSGGKSNYNLSHEICAYCNGPIMSSPLWALGKAWHPQHLLCADCKKPIDPNESFVPHNDKVYCLKDFEKIAYPPCRSCGLPVKGQAVSSGDGKLEGKWHVECFGCHTCHKPFPDKSFYVFKNAPYCRRHYHKLNNSLCRNCDEPIEGPCVQTLEGWRYHPSCFVCFACRSPLMEVYYSFEDKQYCEIHIMEMQRRRKIRAEKRQTMFRNI